MRWLNPQTTFTEKYNPEPNVLMCFNLFVYQAYVQSYSAEVEVQRGQEVGAHLTRLLLQKTLVHSSIIRTNDRGSDVS